jgi:hypothetical protein
MTRCKIGFAVRFIGYLRDIRICAKLAHSLCLQPVTPRKGTANYRVGVIELTRGRVLQAQMSWAGLTRNPAQRGNAVTGPLLQNLIKIVHLPEHDGEEQQEPAHHGDIAVVDNVIE